MTVLLILQLGLSEIWLTHSLRKYPQLPDQATFIRIILYLLQLGFAIILYFDCRRHHCRKLPISLLAIMAPVFGVIFFLLERALILKK